MDAPPIRFPIRILSDLHLGHSGCLVRQVEELRPLVEGAGTIVLNGDTLEERARNFRARSDAMVAALRELCRVEGADVVVLTGNHDPSVSDVHYLDLLGGRVFVTHGDALFKMISPWSKRIDRSRAAIEAIRAEYSEEQLDDLDTRMELTKRSCFEMSAFESEMAPGLWSRLWTFGAELWPPRRPWAILTSWATAAPRAFRLLRRYRPQAEVMVIGHTHRPGVWRNGDKTVVNTGGFLAILNAWVVEIAGDGNISLRKVERRHPDGFAYSKTKQISRCPREHFHPHPHPSHDN
ncbi:hypothetical protein BH23VER1_BH23VER1_14540 [soil metagenome]